MKYRQEIDGLRALAVLPVILFHAGFKSFSGGFVGVDVFFVISGYLITTIISSELEHGNFSIAKFYERRARRILPALFAVMLFCIPFTWIWLSPSDMKDFSKSLIAVSSFSSNIFFWQESGYFDTASELKPLLHTWSLAVEEQYYMLFPLFLMLAWRFGKNWLIATLGLIAIISLALAQWASLIKPSAAFYLLPTRGWELMLGAFAAFYLAKSNYRDFDKSLGDFGAGSGLVLILFSIFYYDKETPFPGLYALTPTIGAVLIILFASQKTFIGKLLGTNAFVAIGLVSYSAYLWHQPLLALARIYTFDQVGIVLTYCLIAATFVLSILSHRYIETPFRNGMALNRKSILVFSISGLSFFSAFGLLGYIQDGHSKRFTREIAILDEAVGDWWFPGPFKKSGDTKGFYVIDKNKPIDILFFGDSHAEQFGPVALKIARSASLNVGFLTERGCPPIPNLLNDQHPQCVDLFERLQRILKTEQSIRTVVIGGCFNCYILDNLDQVDLHSKFNFYYLKDGKKLYPRKGQGKMESLNGFRVFLKELSPKARILVIGDNPLHDSFDPSAMIAAKTRGDTSYFKSKYPDFVIGEFLIPEKQIELNNSIIETIDSLAGYIDSNDIVCNNNICSQLDHNGDPIYKDGNHMRPSFVELQFTEILSKALLGR